MSEGKKEILLGDCLELYKNLEPKSIDLILTDLPYGTTACKWDTIIPFDKLWEMVNYLLKPNGAFITTASQPFTSALVMSNPKMFKYELIWEKNLISGWLNAKKRQLVAHENITIFYNKQPTYNAIKEKRTEKSLERLKYKHETNYDSSYEGYGKAKYKSKTTDSENSYPKSIIKINKTHKENGLHPTQKPIELMQYLLKTYSNEGMTIFDPCMGSGTTGVACKNLNRNFIGIEKDENYFKIAEQRINARTLFS
jgi:DNA modification methylase